MAHVEQATDIFDDLSKEFDHLPEFDVDEVADAVDNVDGDPAGPESFFGYPVIVQGEHAIELAGEWSDDLLNREMIMMRAPKKEWGADSEWQGLTGWMPVPSTWRGLIQTFDAPYLSREKNGQMIVFGEIAPEPGKTTIARRKGT